MEKIVGAQPWTGVLKLNKQNNIYSQILVFKLTYTTYFKICFEKGWVWNLFGKLRNIFGIKILHNFRLNIWFGIKRLERDFSKTIEIVFLIRRQIN